MIFHMARNGKPSGRGETPVSPATDAAFMDLALAEAARAAAAGEVPVGAVIVRDEQVIARAYNRPIGLNDPTAHAEILALRTAARAVNNYRLPETTLYTTLEPCLMCAGALIHARVKRLVFGARDPKGGAIVSVARICEDYPWNHILEYTGGVREERCAEILSGFFAQKRL
ncbi:MAG TPA: tRNA adenosine(34) deaminase TadA [Syntrophales bacterium]|jgi:tRNA(adenine34) deaminase|nr:tRNA adenosine(34) deaminase TadA [Syntrophales bacterium]